MAAPPPRGAPAAREALLPAAAHRGRQALRRRGPAHARGRDRAAGRARLRRPRCRAAPPRGADLRGHPDLQHPAPAAAGDARVVRRRARPRRRAVRVPPDQRVARPDAVVPQDPARRGPGRRAAGPAAGHLALRHRPAGARAGGRADARGGPQPARGGGRSPRRCSPRPAAATTRRPRSARSGRSAAASCSGSPSGDLLGLIDVADVGAGAVPDHRRHPGGDADGGDGVGRPRPRTSTEPPTRMAIVAMGRYGGFELSYGSDADVLFVHDPRPDVDRHEASTYAMAVANELRRLLALPGDDPPLAGRRGPAARGQAGAAGAHPGLLRRLLRQVVEGLGGPGAAARRRRRRRRRTCGGGSRS